MGLPVARPEIRSLRLSRISLTRLHVWVRAEGKRNLVVGDIVEDRGKVMPTPWDGCGQIRSQDQTKR